MKKRRYFKLFIFIAAALAVILFLNMPVSSLQGINYEVRALKMPLYIKIMEFFDRDYQYRQIVKGLTYKLDSDEKKVLAMFVWTRKNIRRIPEGFPVVDDHVLNIIIRGYGAGDQCADVFATLCNYAGYRARFTTLTAEGRRAKVCLAFVRIKKRWYVFDAYNGVYFRNKSGALAATEDLLAGDWIVRPPGQIDIDYAIYFNNRNLSVMDKLARSNIQSPLRRLLYQLKNAFSRPCQRTDK